MLKFKKNMRVLKKEYESLENQKEHYEQAIDGLKSDLVEMCVPFFDRLLTQTDLQSFFWRRFKISNEKRWEIFKINTFTQKMFSF